MDHRNDDPPQRSIDAPNLSFRAESAERGICFFFGRQTKADPSGKERPRDDSLEGFRLCGEGCFRKRSSLGRPNDQSSLSSAAATTLSFRAESAERGICFFFGRQTKADPSGKERPRDDSLQGFCPCGEVLVVERLYYIYILASRSRTLYTGITNNVIRRTGEHREGTVKSFSSEYRIHRLVYNEMFRGVRAAIAREKVIKGWAPADRKSGVEEKEARTEGTR